MKAHELAKLLLETEDIEVKIKMESDYDPNQYDTYIVEDVELYIEVVKSQKGDVIKSKELTLQVIRY